MSCCSIFNKSFLSDADFSTAIIDKTSLTTLLPPFDTKTSGLWRPLVVYNKHSTIKYGDLLSQPDTTLNTSFDPCRCSPVITSYDEIESIDSFRCSYCSSLSNNTNHKIAWKLKDTNGNKSTSLSSNCCNGACDIRMERDDYLPKVPILNQKYLDQFYDFKHMKQFPAVGSGLGFDKFIKFGNGSNNPLNSFTNNSSTPQLCIDWELKPRIGEIPYDPITSQYDNIDDHNKAYKKHLQTGSTCGHFILTKLNNKGSGVISYTSNVIFSGLMGEDSEVVPDTYPLPESTVTEEISDLLPSIEDFSAVPYGFSKNTYNNIFVKTEKLASYWRWNYSSGIIGWYRYYDKDRKNDKRPIPGIDLYISPGDVFYAKNDGPEPLSMTPPESQDQTPVVNTCPSGIKVIKGSEVIGVIPSGSSFTYISANLYPLMRDIYDRIDNADNESRTRPNTMTKLQKFELAALLSTAPQYDAVVVDLLKTTDLDPKQLDKDQNPVNPINEYRQRDQLNKDMSASEIDSVSHMNFISSNEELIHTLGNKYGAYLWCGPNTSSILEFSKDIKSQSYIDLSFDMGVKINDTRKLSGGCSSNVDCLDQTISKQFSYNQTIELGNLKIESKINNRKKYASACNDGAITKKTANMAGIFFNDHLLKEVVYFTGCSIFNNTYPRPFIKDETISCSTCGDGSSYKLALKLNPILCSGFQGDASFCDEPSARFANNSEGFVVGTRPARTIYDESLYHTRKYNAAIMNPRIDKAAFHYQGGVYYDSKIFGANNSTVFDQGTLWLTDGKCRITFTTKDVGIKIYGLNIEKLRAFNQDTRECLGFPNKNECQCFSMSPITDYPHVCSTDGGSITYSNEPLLFTPSLSTDHGPVFASYGGYSKKDISKLLGDIRIPGHPDVGDFIDPLSEKIDPEQPYGCSQSVTVNFPNYVKTEWNFSLPSYNTIHADVWAEVIENVDLFKPRSYSQTFDEDGNLEWTSSPNIGYQRFATRVTLNDTIVYDKQKKVFISKGGGSSSSVTATLVNPYLEALVGNDLVLYPPVGNFCSTNTVFGTLGNQSIDLAVKFERVPRKQMLNFAVPAPVQMGTLKRGFFHPNTGLIYGGDKTDKTSVVRDSGNLTSYIDYDKEVFRKEEKFKDGTMLIGEMNDKLKETLRQISELNNHKKIRLYLKIDNQWWEYNDPNIFGYFKDEKKYIGQPYLFEYTKKDSTTNLSGPILPVSTKEHLDFNFFYNFTYDLFNTQRTNTYYPIVNTKFTRGRDPKKIIIEGSRPYFLVAEKTENNTSRLNTKFTDLQIDYNRKNMVGYVHNTKKDCDQKVLITSKENSKLSYIGKIIEKSIYSIYVDKNGNKLNYNDNIHDKYLRIYTEFVLDANVKYSIGVLDFTFLGKIPQINLENINELADIIDQAEDVKLGVDSLIIYQNIPEALRSENDPLLRNPIYSTKWGDLIDFDGKLINELGEYIYNTGYLHDFYPDSLYKNLFFKTIINNANNNLYNYNFKIKDQQDNLKEVLIKYNGQTSYVIHQKYNIGDGNNSIVRKTFRDYNNYLPFMDINFVPNYGEYENSVRENFKPILKGLLIKDLEILVKSLLQNSSYIYSGVVQISGIYKNLDAGHIWEPKYLNPDDKELFFIDIQKRNELKSSLTIKPDQIFYTNTLRVDDVPFQLYSVESNSVINREGIRSVFTPATPTTAVTFPPITFDFGHFQKTPYTGTPFIKMPVYGDTDRVEGCGSAACGINTIGAVSFSGIYHIQMPKMKSLPQELNDIPYIISYDAGIYNPIGNHQLYYIQRLELNPNNTLYPATNCNKDISPRPTISRISVLNEEYQSIMRDSIVDDHTEIVKKTDIFANEILFRMRYGQKQKINLKTIDDHTTQTIKFNDLIKYTDPKIEAKDIYKNIPYNLDKTAIPPNRKINGSLSIQGKLIVGKSVSVTIGNKNMTISVRSGDGKIKIVVDIDGQTIESVIHTEYVTSHSLAVSDQKLSDTSTTKYTLLTQCQEIASHSVSFMSAHPKGVLYNTFKCDGVTREDLKLPYWGSEKSCNLGSWRPGMPDPTCNPDYGSPPGYVVQYRPSNGCLGTIILDTPEFLCTNLGIGYSVKDLMGPDCKQLTSTSRTIKYGRYSRGVFSGCYAEGSINGLLIGRSLENAIGGRIIQHPQGIGSLRSVSEPSCGTCFTDSYKNPLTDNLYYSAINGRSFPPAMGDTEDHCDCIDWEYGYCQNSADGRCACDAADGPLQYDYQPFDYNFEYCRYQIALKGHKRKIKYGTSDARKTIPLPSCRGYSGNGETAGPIGEIGGEAVEECVWIECDTGAPGAWYIYDAVTTSPTTPYNPLCPTNLCSINYDNNSLTINLPGGPPHCVSHRIRNNCPIIKVTVPDDSFTVSDSISSSCDNCGVEPNKITMPPQIQQWEIITETRTCMLGYFLSSPDKNVDGPVAMGVQTIGCGLCNGCSAVACGPQTYTNGGMGLCGREAPDSFPWSTCISFKMGDPEICVKGNMRYPTAIVAGCDIPITYPASNTVAQNRMKEIWKNQMEQNFRNIAPCNNNGSLNVGDIVEGVVPEDCAGVFYKDISYPAITYRATLTDTPAVEKLTATYTVAYYTYRYRRPKTVQDTFKTDVIRAKCDRIKGSCPTGSINTTEIYKTADCDSTPQCYNTDIPVCDDANYCCRAGKKTDLRTKD